MNKRNLVVVLSFLLLSGTAITIAWSGTGKESAKPLAQIEQIALTEKELIETFKQKEETPIDVQAEIGDSLLAQIKSKQPAFNEEEHGYFHVIGDSMTPNFYEGDVVKLQSKEYTEGDFVALTVNATGEHLLKQFAGGELVSSNANGAYYHLADVTVHGKVAKAKTVTAEVNQTLQAATGVYAVDVDSSTTSSATTIYVLLSNGDVYGRYTYGNPTNTATNPNTAWSANTADSAWVKSGSTFPVTSNSVPVSLAETTLSGGTNIHVMLSNGDVYGRYSYGVPTNTVTNPNTAWSANTADSAWVKSGSSIPQALVSPSSGGAMSSLPQNRLVGRISSGTGDAEYLTATQTKDIIGTTSFLYYPVGTTAASVGMTEIKSYNATTKMWKSNTDGDVVYHTIHLYNPPTSIGDLTIK